MGQVPTGGCLLDAVFDRVVGVLDGFDGAAWTDSVVDALAPTSADGAQRRLIAGMVRAALDRAEERLMLRNAATSGMR